MQALAKLSVHRPVVATVMILVLAVLGLVSYQKLGVDRFPNVDIPYVTVTTTLAGATPEEMETQVTEQIEKQVNTVSGIDTLSSTSAEGISSVVIGFMLEKNADAAFNEVRAKVDLAMADLPKDADKPVVQKIDSGSSAILSIALSSNSTSVRDLTEFADKKLRPQIENVNGVGEVEILGGQSRQINVMLDANALRAYNLSAIDVANALQAGNLQVPGGALDQGDRRISVRTRGRAQSMDELRDLVVQVRDDHPVRIRDIATVEDGGAEAESLANVNGKRAVLLNIRKQSGANTVAVIDAVKQRMDLIKSKLPADYSTKIVTDQSVYIRAALNAVKEHLILGAILAAVVVLLFLWNWRSALISSIAIPTSLISTFALMAVMGFTLNVITMLALTLAVGIVIDDAVIVLENIYRFIQQKKITPRQAALEATQEIGLAVLATTFTLLAVFVPIAFMSGIVGRFMNSFGLTMAFAIAVSLLVAFTLTPMLSARWLHQPKETLKSIVRGDGLRGPVFRPIGESTTEQPVAEEAKPRRVGAFARLENGYEASLRWSLGHRWVVMVASLAVFFSIVPLGKMSKVNFIPDDDESQFLVSVRAPEGTSLSATETLLNHVATDIRKMPEVAYTLVTVADDRQRSANSGTVTVKMNEVEARKVPVTEQDLMTRARALMVAKYPRELRTTVSPPNVMGGGASAVVQYVVTGPNLDVLTRTASKAVTDLRQSPLIADCDTSSIPGKPEIGVSVDRNAAADLGVSVSNIATTMRILVAGQKVSDYADGGYQYDINLRALPQYRDRETNLALFTVPSTKANVGAVPIDQVVTYRQGSGLSSINRLSRNRQVTISANPVPGASEQSVQQLIANNIARQNLGAAYHGELIGRSRELGRTMAAFMMSLLLAIVFMYLILSAQFESWLYPGVILTALPLTMPFALLSINLTGGSLNIFTMLGMLVLFGVVVKNAILQVDHTIGLRASGMPRTDAILTACKDRLRPILMTTIAFVAGMIPLAVSNGTGAGTNRAMSSVIIGGQVLSLVLTLLATPVFFSITDDVAEAIHRLHVRIFGEHEADAGSSTGPETPAPAPGTTAN